MRIHVTTAEGGAAWSLSLARFAEELAAYRPDALISVDADKRNQQVRFELTLRDDGADGHDGADDLLHRAEGIYFIGDWQQLVCWDGSIDGWAPVIVWFLGLLPPGAEANIFLEAVAVPRRLARSATAADVARMLRTVR